MKRQHTTGPRAHDSSLNSSSTRNSLNPRLIVVGLSLVILVTGIVVLRQSRLAGDKVDESMVTQQNRPAENSAPAALTNPKRSAAQEDRTTQAGAKPLTTDASKLNRARSPKRELTIQAHPSVRPHSIHSMPPFLKEPSSSTLEAEDRAARQSVDAESRSNDQEELRERESRASIGRRISRPGGNRETDQSTTGSQETKPPVITAGPEVQPFVGPVSQDNDLRKLQYIPPAGEDDDEPLRRHPKVEGHGVNDPDPSIKKSAEVAAMPPPAVSFDGMSIGLGGCACVPPDPHGDVGPNHYIQSVNSSIKIFDKTGMAMNGAIGTTYNSFFSALGNNTPCGNNQNRGDGIVFYDHLADRWVVSDFAYPSFPGTSFYQCVGVSKTADPVAGGWWLYALQVDPSNPSFLGDYPKFGLWPDAYYFSVNMFSNNTTFNGVRVYALNRSAMLNGTGAPNTGAVAFTITPADLGDSYSLVPATFRTGSQPPAGRPEYFLAVRSPLASGVVQNQVFAWRFHVDFTTPANSTFGVGTGHTPDGTITVNDFVDAYTDTEGSAIIPESGTTRKLDSLGDRLMTPLVYQNLEGTESLWVSHTVNNNQNGTGATAIRWYQFDITGNTIPATPVQQQSFNNGADGLWRFMPSISVDAQGNMSIAYNASSSSTFPAIKYAGRLAADPLNSLAQGEAQLIAGGGSQTTISGRWGDYSSLAIDPADNCTFWHTNEYFTATSSSTWSTRIGAFKFPTCTSPTQAKVKTFTAKTLDDGRVLLQWSSSIEVDNLGYNVYREQNGVRTRITPQLVAGSALLEGPGKSLLSGHSYSWFDNVTAGSSAARYWLEDIDLNGKSTLNGPYETSLSLNAKSSEATRQSLLLTQLGLHQSMLMNGAASQPVEHNAVLGTATEAALQAQTAIAAKPALKLAIKKEGFYRVTQAELIGAGLDPTVDPRSLQMFVDGTELPIKVLGEKDGRFDASDAIEFYATGVDVPSTDTRTYWLVAGSQPGKRINTTAGKGGLPVSGGFPYSVERKDRSIYFAALKNGDAENFFGALVVNQPVDQSLWVQHLNQAPSTSATVEVSLQGVTQFAHTVRLQLNGSDIGTLNFAGQAAGRVSIAVPTSLLKNGENHVQLIAQGGLNDISLVDVIRITYSHSYAADSNALRLVTQANRQINIGGFTSSSIRLLDVTDPNAVQEIVGTVSADKGIYGITASVPGAGERVVMALADSEVKTPAAITANHPSQWRQPANGADLLVFTPREFAASLQPLVALRQRQGFRVAVIDIEDAYDEFSFGNKSPQAVKDFISYATSSWKKAPRFVLFAGSSTYDPRNYLGFGDYDLIPSRLIDTKSMQTASDDWFVDVNGTGVPSLAIGRLPIRNSAEATVMVAKIIGYEQSSASEEATLVADVNDGFNFELASRQLRALLPDALRVNQINRGAADTGSAKNELLAAIARGQKIVNYTGHGNASQWRDNLLNTDDARALTNADHLPLFVMMNCLNGYFIDPAIESLGSSLMKAEHGGAAAVWASSGITDPGDQARLNQQLFQMIFPSNGDSGLRLGEAVRKAKAAIGDPDVRRTWILLGDPTMKVK